MDVLGIGHCTTDILLKIDGAIELNRKIEASELSLQGGGPVGTAMTALASWGIRSGFAGSIGDDLVGHFIRSAFEARGVDIEFLKVTGGASSPLSSSVTQRGGLRTIFYSKGSAPPLTVEDLQAVDFKSLRAIEIDGHQSAAQAWAAQKCIAAGVPVVLDAGSLRPEIQPLLDLAHHIVASREFADHFSPTGDYEQACLRLYKGEARAVVVTLGEKGSLGYDGKKIVQRPPVSVDVVDTLGAGDVYHAGYIYGLVKGWDLDRRMAFASVAAGLKCRGMGGQTPIPSLEEIQKEL